MTTIATPTVWAMSSRWRLVLRVAILAMLLLVEVIGLSVRFDSKGLASDGGWPVWLLGHAPQALRWVIGVMMASLLFVPAGSWSTLSERLGTRPPRRIAWAFLAGHLGAFAAFAVLSSFLFESASPGTIPAAWIGLWFALGLLVLGLLAGVLLPLETWARLASRARSGLFLGAVIALAALVVSQSTSQLWRSLHETTFRLAAAILTQIYGERVICEPARFMLGAREFTVRIAAQCSGYEGIGLIWVFLGAYLLLFRRELRFPHALLLLPLGTLVIWLANVFRIVMLIVLGTEWSSTAALGGFHSQAGWLAFNAVGLGLVAVSRHTGLFSRRGPNPVLVPNQQTLANPAAAYLVPMLVIVATSMLTGALSDGRFDRFYPVRVLVAVVALWYFRRAYGPLRGAVSWSAVGIGAVVFALWMALEPASSPQAGSMGLLSTLPRPVAAAWIVARVFGSVVTVPIAEELAFRGYLTRRLVSAEFEAVPPGSLTVPALILSSLLFGAMHQRWFAGSLAGALYAVAYHGRGSLGDAVVAHATTNALIAVAVLAGGQWQLWS